MQRRKCQRKCNEGRKSDVSWPRNKLHFLAQALRWCKSSPHSFSVAIPLHQHFQLDWLSAFSRSDNSQSYTSPKAILLTAECWSLPSNTAFVPVSALGWLWMQTEVTKWCHCWKLGWGERHTWAGLVSISELGIHSSAREGFLGDTQHGEVWGILVVLVHCPLNIPSRLLLLLWTIPDEALEMFGKPLLGACAAPPSSGSRPAHAAPHQSRLARQPPVGQPQGFLSLHSALSWPFWVWLQVTKTISHLLPSTSCHCWPFKHLKHSGQWHEELCLHLLWETSRVERKKMAKTA